ncbi:MAG: hypothetical protein ACRYF0_10905 [Janthinobacterium lividum]
MKKLCGLIMLAGAGSACQQQSPSTKAVSMTAASPTVAQVAPKPKEPVVAVSEELAPAPVAGAGPASSPVLSNVLQRYDLSALWQGKYDDDVKEMGPMDGFFGRDYRRIAFVFTKVYRDSLQPTVYRVEGKNRFQKTVSPFTGTITIQTVAHPKASLTMEEAGLLDVESLRSVFSAKAKFEFREQPQGNTAGIFTGAGYLDFYIDKENKLHSAISMMEASPAMLAKGAGVLYTGQWVSDNTGASKPLLLSGNVFITAPATLTRFAIGDRDPSFNPKYAKLGWNDYWANDEWWADSPKPSLSM